MKELKFIFKEIWHKDPLMYFIIIVNAIIDGLLPFIWILAPAYVIDNIDKDKEFFIPFFIILFLITSLMRFLNSFLTGNYRMRMNNLRYGLNNTIIEYSLNLSYEDQEDKKQKELIRDAMRAVEYPFDGFGGIVFNLPYGFSLIVSLFAYIWIFKALPWYLLIYIVLLTTIVIRIIYKITFIYEDYWEKIDYTWEEVHQLNYELKNPISKLDIIMYDIKKIFRKYYFQTTKFRDDNLHQADNTAIRLSFKARLISLMRDLVVFYWIITNLSQGNIKISDFYVLFTAVFSFMFLIDRISERVGNFVKDLKFFKYYFKIQDYKKTSKEKIDLDHVDIRLVNVSFKYPSSDRYILKNINLDLSRNQSIAIVGENGAGKTTLALILAGLYCPTSGRILLNGKDIESYNIDPTSYVSAIFQDTLLLPYSIRENVAMNSDDYDLSDIYQKSSLDKLIKKYDKLDEQVLLRTMDDSGVDLSGGQKQRVFLARALNKKSAKVLILDEPTAQLDAIAEKELYELYNQMSKDKSSVFISHRLASTKFCDKVIFLKNGEIIEEGTHQELLDKAGEYKELYEIQAKNYKEECNA